MTPQPNALKHAPHPVHRLTALLIDATEEISLAVEGLDIQSWSPLRCARIDRILQHATSRIAAARAIVVSHTDATSLAEEHNCTLPLLEEFNALIKEIEADNAKGGAA